MKKLIIILVVVGLSFLALLVYGTSRQDSPGDGCSRLNGDDPDEKDLEDWCPPSFTDATSSLQTRFAKSIEVGGKTMQASEVGAGIFVPLEGERGGSVKVHLETGEWTILKGESGGKTSVVCLCRPGTEFSARMKDECPDRWRRAKQSFPKPGQPPMPPTYRAKCEKGDDVNVVPVLEGGATIKSAATLTQSLPSAKVRFE